MYKPRILIGIIVILGSAMNVAQASDYFNGFEVDTYNWFELTRVASGNDGITSASGSYHAVSDTDPNPFTRWGGYNDDPACAGGGTCPGTFPVDGYDTSIDIYLDVDGGYANDARFDFDSAVSQANGGFRRDFIFNCGFYDDDTDSGANGTPGAGVNRFICSASNNSQPNSAYAKNPGRMPTVVATTSGWYTFRHQFRDDGSGVLTVDLSVLNSVGTVIQTWTLSDSTDLIGTTVGGNRYGWIACNQLGELALDNAQRTSIVPVPLISCVGSDTGIFDAPLDMPVTVNKRARTLPFNMMLIDEYGNALTDADITPPMIAIKVTPGDSPSAPPPEELESVGKGDDGNLFTFSGVKWGFNLKTKNFSGAGEYTVTVISSDPSSYVVSPTCEGSFYITR